MSEVRIVQCLCPKRHCIVGLAYEMGQAALGSDGNDIALSPETAPSWLRGVLDGMILTGVNPWCGLCGAERDSWIYEDAKSKFTSIEEARPELERLEREQAFTRMMFSRG
jgi:hypothetical protein